MGKKLRVPKEYLGAFKYGHRRGVREYIDDEFAYSLLPKAKVGCKKSIEALEWLTRYNNETYRGVLKKGDPEALHNTPELYKAATTGHNERRRDITCVVKSGKMGGGEMHELDSEMLDKKTSLYHEDTMIDLLSPKAKGRVESTLKLPTPKKKRRKRR